MSVDEYIERKVPPEYREVMTLLREFIREAVPDAEESIYYGQPMYKKRNLVFAWITPSKKGIALSFLRGVKFEDKYGLLEGNAKWSRYVKIKKVDDLNKEALRYYIKQAIKLESK